MKNSGHVSEVQFFERLAENLRNQGVMEGNPVEDKRYPLVQRHPMANDIRRLETIMRKLQYECIGYKYTVYRCAIKIVTLQRILFTAYIPYKLVLAVLERHNIKDADANLMVPPFQLTSLLHDVYFASERFGFFNNMGSLHLLKSTTIMLANFFWDIFDPHRRHSVSLMEIKVTFLFLCKLYPTDHLISELFKIISNAKTKHITKLHFESLINIMTRMMAYLGENDAYGSHNIPVVMGECFTKDHLSLGLSSTQFEHIWLKKRTRFLIYANLIALVKRIESTERLSHSSACAGPCKSDRIVGILFRCQSCRDFSLCLRCFAAGYQDEKHQPGHRMFEVFGNALMPNKKFSHYLAKLCCSISLGCKRSAPKDIDSNNDCGYNNTESTIYNDNAQLIETTSSISQLTYKKGDLSAANNYQNPALITVSKACPLSPSPVTYYLPEQNCVPTVNTHLEGLSNTAYNAINASERLQSIIDKLLIENRKLEIQLRSIRTTSQEEITAFLKSHQQFLMEIISEMRTFAMSSKPEDSAMVHPISSMPSLPLIESLEDRSVASHKIQDEKFKSNSMDCLETISNKNTLSDYLTHSINGADVNRSYLDANKSNYSMSDLSCWFSQSGVAAKPASCRKDRLMTFATPHSVTNTIFSHRDTDMSNFKLLLSKVKEIVDDSYSDNTELSEATQNLENVLDSIIHCEEKIRYARNESILANI